LRRRTGHALWEWAGGRVGATRVCRWSCRTRSISSAGETGSLHVLHTQSAKGWWLADLDPVNMAVPAIGFLPPSPKEGSLYLFNLLQDFLLARARRPALGIRCAIQLGSLSATLATICCNCAQVGRRIVKGIPRYVMGSSTMGHPRPEVTVAGSSVLPFSRAAAYIEPFIGPFSFSVAFQHSMHSRYVLI